MHNEKKKKEYLNHASFSSQIKRMPTKEYVLINTFILYKVYYNTMPTMFINDYKWINKIK